MTDAENSGAGFERIGPYRLTRWDLFVAGLVISFLLGSVVQRIWASFVVLICLAAIVGGMLNGMFVIVVVAALWLCVFCLAPFYRSRKGYHPIVLEQVPDGLAFDTLTARVVHKWSAIRRVRKVGSRLFIMTVGNYAIVIPDRITPPANRDALLATIAEHRPA